jgi:hypothetical protein
MCATNSLNCKSINGCPYICILSKYYRSFSSSTLDNTMSGSHFFPTLCPYGWSQSVAAKYLLLLQLLWFLYCCPVLQWLCLSLHHSIVCTFDFALYSGWYKSCPLEKVILIYVDYLLLLFFLWECLLNLDNNLEWADKEMLGKRGCI